MSDDISVERVLAPTDEVRTLVEDLEGELSVHYAAAQRHGLKLEEIFRPHIRFFVARINGEAIGCGGVALSAGFAEVKRMYVRPGSRGSGAADAIIARLQSEAAQMGLNVLRLETGTAQLAAIRFYERHGFAICPPFEPYVLMEPHAIETSVFMEKRIST